MIEVRRIEHGSPVFEVVAPEHCLENVTAISRYFPEFEREMPRYLSQS